MLTPRVSFADDELLEEELRELKSRLRCSVQPTEWKDRIIVSQRPLCDPHNNLCSSHFCAGAQVVLPLVLRKVHPDVDQNP